MIIDLILDRKCDEEDIANGYTHKQYPDGKLEPLAYDPRKFYYAVMNYVGDCEGEDYAEKITKAMDYGTENDVKSALNNYLIKAGYGGEICKFVNSVNWL